MKKALMLGSLFLHAGPLLAAEMSLTLIIQGKRRNEDAMESTLKAAGWMSEKDAARLLNKSTTPHHANPDANTRREPPPKPSPYLH